MNATKRLILTAAAVLLIAVAVLLVTPPLHAAQDQWLGTWKLNRSLSHLMAPPITIVRTLDGYHFDFGAVRFDIGDDGEDYPTVPTRTTSLKPIGQREWFRVHKVNGKESDHSTIRITPDNRVMLIHTVATEPSGATHVSNDVLERLGPGAGLAGTWRSTSGEGNVAEAMTFSSAGSGRIRWEIPSEGQYYVVAPNGPPAVNAGPRSVPGVTLTLKTVSGTEMHWTELIDGKPLTEGIDSLSANGSILTETTWAVARPADRQQAVYQRQ